MPKLRPFAAIRYQAAAGADISVRIAPPYDVLDEGPKRDLLKRDPHNVVAIDLPVTPPKTLGPDAAYEAAGDLYRQWIGQGVLKRDAQPAVYAYEQVYTVGDRQFARRGLFACLDVEEFNRPGGGIFRHEMTIKGGTDDRLKLMLATAAQLSPVFGIYQDPDRAIAPLLDAVYQRSPDFHGTTPHDHVEHRCWIVTDKAVIDRLAAAFLDRDVFIADGHHRYTTALNYAKAHPSEAAARGCLFVLVAAEDPGLIILPTHRVLCGLVDFSMSKLVEAVKADGRFTLRPTHHGADGMPHMGSDLPTAGHHAVGLYDPSTGRTWALTSTTDDPLAGSRGDKPRAWRMLDVAVFHDGFVDGILRPSFGGAAITYKYPHELTEFVRLSHEQAGRLGAVMQATPLSAVCDVARADEVMPPKSTFFFPKLATGLVINGLR
jgi:uncharacterized protein (DUF1015 family)